MARLLKSPALHFLLLGALLFVLLSGGPLAEAPYTRAIDEVLEEELLVQEALTLRVDRSERFVQSRLLQLAQQLEIEGTAFERLASVRELGLHASDPIVRRHLAQVMRSHLSRLGTDERPNTADLRAYWERERELFRAPDRIRLHQVFLSRNRRGVELDQDAAALLQELRENQIPGDEADRYGDPWAVGRGQLVASAAELDHRFGPGFAEKLVVLPARQWSEPVSSVYGAHLVWIEERILGEIPTLQAVQGRLYHDLLKQRQEARYAKRLRSLATKY